MPKRLVISKDRVSESANSLHETINGSIKVAPDGNYVPRATDVILNWGATEKPAWSNNLHGARVLNHWDKLQVSVNKLRAFEALRAGAVPIPDFSTNIADARNWIAAGNTVIARQILNGSGGEGIVVCKTVAEVNAATNVKLWTKYFKADKEVRVFIVRNTIIDFAQKKKKVDFTGHNMIVRNLAGGWIYARENVILEENLRQACLKAVQVLGLDIGAVDARYNAQGQVCILEINSSPGLAESGTSLALLSGGISSFLSDNPIIPAAALNNAPPIAPFPVTTPVNTAPVPVIQTPPTPTIARNTGIPAGIGKGKYDLGAFSEVEIETDGSTTKVYGKIPGFAKRLLLLERNASSVKWLGDHFLD